MDQASNQQTDFEFIERYYAQQLDAVQLKEFELRRENDPDFDAQVREYLSLFEGVETHGLRLDLEQFHQELNTSEVIDKSVSWKKWSIAAAFVLGATLFGYLLLKPSQPEVLFAKYFEPDPGLPTLMSQTDEADYLFSNAMVAYKQGEYQKAISVWDALESKDSNDTIGYFIGVAYLADERADKAIEYLQPLAEKSVTAFREEIFYYLGLAYLKEDRVELAKKNLNFSSLEKSKQLLAELKN